MKNVNLKVETVYNDYTKRSGVGIPTLVINDKLYLQPFRFYRMQVSATPEQSGSVGESEVLGLLNLATMCRKRPATLASDGYQANVPIFKGLIDQLSTVALYDAIPDREEVLAILHSNEYETFIVKTVQFIETKLLEIEEMTPFRRTSKKSIVLDGIIEIKIHFYGEDPSGGSRSKTCEFIETYTRTGIGWDCSYSTSSESQYCPVCGQFGDHLEKDEQTGEMRCIYINESSVFCSDENMIDKIYDTEDNHGWIEVKKLDD
jgi:hypothetical protein